MAAPNNTPAVVLVHGLWLSGWAMTLIARRLRRAGFRTYLFSYPSVGRRLHANARALRAFSDTIDAGTVHFVGHSLGGVVIRTMLGLCPPPRPGRVVTLGSPHGGSHVARTISRCSCGRRLIGASIGDLLRGEVPDADISEREVGLIQGNMPIGLGRLFPGLPSPNDGVVAVREAQWSGVRDTLVLRVAHTAMLVAPSVSRATCQFLRFGHFVR